MKIYDYSGRANISGDRIHQARTAQRLSQDALAAKMQVCGVGLGREAISRIEGIRCGYKSTSCPDQLAQALKAYKASQT